MKIYLKIVNSAEGLMKKSRFNVLVKSWVGGGDLTKNG